MGSTGWDGALLADDCAPGADWFAEVAAGAELPCEHPQVAIAPASTKFRPAFIIVGGVIFSTE